MKKPEKYVFYDSPRARFVAEFYRGEVYLHLTLHEWGMQVMRDLRLIWPEIRTALARIGYERIFAYNRDTERLWPKFMANFGFQEARRSNGWLFMEAANA